MVCTTSSAVLNPIQPLKPSRPCTIAYHLRERGTANGSAASSTTPANSIARREMLEPICELTSQTAGPRPYTAAVMRTVVQSSGPARGRAPRTGTAGRRAEGHRLGAGEREQPGRQRHDHDRRQPERLRARAPLLQEQRDRDQPEEQPGDR